MQLIMAQPKKLSCRLPLQRMRRHWHKIKVSKSGYQFMHSMNILTDMTILFLGTNAPICADASQLGAPPIAASGPDLVALFAESPLLTPEDKVTIASFFKDDCKIRYVLVSSSNTRVRYFTSRNMQCRAQSFH